MPGTWQVPGTSRAFPSRNVHPLRPQQEQDGVEPIAEGVTDHRSPDPPAHVKDEGLDQPADRKEHKKDPEQDEPRQPATQTEQSQKGRFGGREPQTDKEPAARRVHSGEDVDQKALQEEQAKGEPRTQAKGRYVQAIEKSATFHVIASTPFRERRVVRARVGSVTTPSCEGRQTSTHDR